ncbi:MAG: hypothetical protein IT372_42615 [Polyangiaceae bacterium]|nr:hypothetical protein [Polyangiaceae bacterium]
MPTSSDGRRSRPDDMSEPPPSSELGYDAAARERARTAAATAGRAEERAEEALRLAASTAEQVRAIQSTLGDPPAPGRPGSGLVAEFMRLERQVTGRLEKLEQGVEAVLQELRQRAPATPRGRRRGLATGAAVAAIVTALGGAGAAVVSAIRGGATTASTRSGPP